MRRDMDVVRCLSGLLLLLVAAAAGAGKVETLVMPGPVTAAHAKFETECKKCHELFSRASQNQQCLSCHKAVAADLRAKTGYHGRAPGIDGRECKSCHTDHKGRGVDIVKLDRETFAHDQTDYALHGAHLKVECNACHKPGAGFRKAPQQCRDCHLKDDTHRGKLGKVCADCHSERGWHETRFDHSKTRYKLDGKHREVSCDSCHPNQRYKATPTECVSCHAGNDVHHGRFGAKCVSCHTTQAWKKAKFDHDRDTHFSLIGAHKTATCAACHKGDPLTEKLPTACNDCHARDDVHQGRNGTDCKRCHGSGKWSQSAFKHDRDTKYPLRGLHAKAACQACHTGPMRTQNVETACYACHKADDVHRGQEGRECQNCHNEGGWGKQVKFEHDLTRFPLLGAHATTSCEDCHASAAYKDAELDCAACHGKDDTHKTRLGKDCASCHNPNSWQAWNFDHNTRTHFKLEGKHEGLDCLACHTRPVDKKVVTASACNDCHARDDVHQGGFSTHCAQCHSTASFKEVEMVR